MKKQFIFFFLILVCSLRMQARQARGYQPVGITQGLGRKTALAKLDHQKIEQLYNLVRIDNVQKLGNLFTLYRQRGFSDEQLLLKIYEFSITKNDIHTTRRLAQMLIPYRQTYFEQYPFWAGLCVTGVGVTSVVAILMSLFLASE